MIMIKLPFKQDVWVVVYIVKVNKVSPVAITGYDILGLFDKLF